MKITHIWNPNSGGIWLPCRQGELLTEGWDTKKIYCRLFNNDGEVRWAIFRYQIRFKDWSIEALVRKDEYFTV